MVCDNYSYETRKRKRISLNPYSIGIWSATPTLTCPQGWGKLVLILILLEYGLRRRDNIAIKLLFLCLNPYSIGIWSATIYTEEEEEDMIEVLILILLEYGLRPAKKAAKEHKLTGLNPYSIGIWSATG